MEGRQRERFLVSGHAVNPSMGALSQHPCCSRSGYQKPLTLALCQDVDLVIYDM